MRQLGKTIVSFPKISNKNYYQQNFYLPLIASGFSVRDWSIFDLLKTKYFLHIHWPESWKWAGPVGKFLCIIYLLSLPVRKAFFGIYVINTVHNLNPHEKQTKFGKWFYHWTLCQVDHFIHLSAEGLGQFSKAYPEFNRSQHSVIHHPLYNMERYNSQTAKASLRLPPNLRIFLQVGMMRKYKGIERLISAFSKFSGECDYLVVAGDGDIEYCNELVRHTRGCGNIEIRRGFISDSDLNRYFAAADVVVLPYLSQLNSGVLIHAVSACKPIFLPNSSIFHEIQSLCNGEGFHFFDPNRFDDDFKSLLANSMDGSSQAAVYYLRNSNYEAATLRLFSRYLCDDNRTA